MTKVYLIRERLDRILTNFALFFFTLGVIATFFGVLFRFSPIFPSLSWTDELTRFCMIITVFLVTGIGIRRGSQIAFTLVLEKLPKPFFKTFTIINSLLMITFLSIVGFYGFKLALINKDQLSAVMQIPMIYPYLIFPIGSFFMILENVVQIIEVLRGTLKRSDESHIHINI